MHRRGVPVLLAAEKAYGEVACLHVLVHKNYRPVADGGRRRRKGAEHPGLSFVMSMRDSRNAPLHSPGSLRINQTYIMKTVFRSRRRLFMRDALGIAGICELLPDFRGGNASRIRSSMLIGRRGLMSPGKRKREQEQPPLSGSVILRQLFARWNTPRRRMPGKS